MADNLRDFSEEDDAVEQKSDSSEKFDFPQTLVTEKIIFVIDLLLLTTESDGDVDVQTILDLCKTYFNLKKKICIKPPEFECILYNNKQIRRSQVSNAKDLQSALINIRSLECEEESQPLKIDKIFDVLAPIVELPDSVCSRKCLPPNYVYHVVWLFGQNLYVPTMENTNSFDFLMMTPYFALDILYLYNEELKDNQCEKIAQGLRNLNENGKGYFLLAKLNSTTEQVFSCFAQFLGHPLMRVPQSQARYNILEFHHDCEVHNDAKENS